MISGSLPKEISNLSSLRELWLGENNITGSIPDNIGDMKSLGKSYQFHQNFRIPSIQAHIDSTVSHFGLPTEQLSLYGMAMSGTIPSSLYNLTHLKGLYLRNNNPGYKGPIKSEIGNLLQLKELVLHDNPLLTGTLPSELGLCQNLSKT